MKKNYIFRIAAILFAVCVLACACKTSKPAAGYATTQTKPTTVEQQQAADRGLKLAKEECEEKALEPGKGIRDAGNAISDKEAFATNLALLDARQKLAQQLEVLVSGLIRNFNQQHEQDGEFSSLGKATGLTQAYFEQFLTNTRPICKNTYVKQDGKYNVYVCVEMDENMQRSMYKKLTEDKKMHIDFEESQFLKELEKSKEDYRKQRQ